MKKRFQEPIYDEINFFQVEAVSSYKQLEYTLNIPLEQITFYEDFAEWSKFKGKKATDSIGTSAYMLKQLPQEYINIITVLFNKCASKGEFL